MSCEAVFQQHLGLLVEACRTLVPDLTAVILYGGFGRDEGSWFEDETGAWHPYNDYDICIVSDVKASRAEVKALELSLAREIGINWIDLHQLSPDELTHLGSSIKNYDFKNASKVIAGDSSVLDLIPDIDATSLSMKEAQILYFTRLYTLLGSLDEKGLDQSLSGEASRFFRNQMAKAILAVVDVLLLAKGAYDASYCKRADLLAELYPEKQELIELSHWALEEKLRPQAPEMNSEEVRTLYGTIHDHYLREMYRGLSLRFGKSVRGPEDVERCLKWLPVSFMKRVYWLLKFRDLRAERQHSILLAQSYIAAAWKPGGMSEELLRKGVAFLRRVDSGVARKLTWDEARVEAARLRMEV